MTIALEDVDLSNADEVIGFIEAHRTERYEVGESFTLPDIGQTYTIAAVRPFSKKGKFFVYLDLQAQCAVDGCANPLACSVDIGLWRSHPALPRCCTQHRYGFKTPMEGAWKTLEERERIMENRDRIAARKSQRERAKVCLRANSSRSKHERVVLGAVDELKALGVGVCSDAALAKLACAKLPIPEGRDTRRQHVLRAMRSLRRKGLLQAAPESI